MIKCVCVSIVRDRGHNFNKLVRVLRTTIFCKKRSQPQVPSCQSLISNISEWAMSIEHQAKRHRRDVIISFLWRSVCAISSIINGMCLEFYDSANTKADHQWAILFRTIFNFVWSPEPILVLEMGFVVWWIKLTHNISRWTRIFRSVVFKCRWNSLLRMLIVVTAFYYSLQPPHR